MKIIRYKKEFLVLKFHIPLVLYVLALSVMFVLFFVGGPSYYSSPVYKELWNIGHIIFFFLSTHMLITRVKNKSLLTVAIISFSYCLILGATVELIQSKVGRSVDLHDLYRDTLGTLLAISLYVNRQKSYQKIKYATHSLVVISVLLILIDQVKLIQVIKIDIDAHESLPYLTNFESDNELKRWQGKKLSLSTEHVLVGLYSMKAELSSKTKYSGFSLKHMPKNWEGYSYLLINIYNPDKNNLKINVKITDYEHDLSDQLYNNRYNNSYTLLPGHWNTIKIKLADIKNSPKKRKLNLTEMSQLGLFTSGLKENKIIYLGAITLI